MLREVLREKSFMPNFGIRGLTWAQRKEGHRVQAQSMEVKRLSLKLELFEMTYAIELSDMSST